MWAPLSYSSVDDAVRRRILHLGQLVKSRPTTPSAHSTPTLSGDFMGEKCICGSSSAIWAKIRAEKFHCGADMIAWVLHRAGIQDQSHYFNDFLFSPPPPPPPATDVAARPLSVAVFHTGGGNPGISPQTNFFTQTFYIE